MREYNYDEGELAGWKTYPVRVKGQHLSKCHQAPTLMVQSMEGGYVTANCSKCGNKSSVSQADFDSLQLWVSCPECRGRMVPCIYRKNYGYSCEDCDLFVRLAHLLPRWRDLMPD